MGPDSDRSLVSTYMGITDYRTSISGDESSGIGVARTVEPPRAADTDTSDTSILFRTLLLLLVNRMMRILLVLYYIRTYFRTVLPGLRPVTTVGVRVGPVGNVSPPELDTVAPDPDAPAAVPVVYVQLATSPDVAGTDGAIVGV